MKSLIIIIITIAIAISILFTCRKNPTDIVEPDQLPDFPITTGSYWKYHYTDSLAQSTDTVTVIIAGNKTFENNRKAKIWEYHFSSRIDTKFVFVEQDTVLMYSNPVLFEWYSTKYIFPLEIGKGWTGNFISDTNSVISKEHLELPGGKSIKSFVIKETWAAFNDYGLLLTWFVPKVGVIKKHRRGASFGRANELWELLEYHIK